VKTLFLVRHAKSSWKHEHLTDFERPLNKRGKRDAPFMGQLLKKQGIIPDLILSSPAVRALTTAQVLAEEMGYPVDQIEQDKEVYHASTDHLLHIIRQVDGSVDVLMVFGHNPGITLLANLLTNHYIDNVPTTGIVRVKFGLNRWKDVRAGKGQIVSFDFPKKYITPE